MNEQQRRRGAGSPAEGSERISRAYPLLPAEQVEQIVKDHARKNGATVIHSGERRDVKGAEIADAWFDFGTEDDDQAEPALVGDADDPGAWSLAMRIVPPQLEIDLLELDAYAAAVLGKPRPVAENEPAKDRGGRPAKHDWHRAMGQILLRVRDLGIPRTQAELVKETLDWFSGNSTEIPDRRAVERWIAHFWPRGPRQLGPSE